MKGAREYYELFTSGEQIGRLYFRTGQHARGKYFHIYVLPEGVNVQAGEKMIPQGMVEVYGITGGNPGWSEYYGWLHKGPWVDDFNAIVLDRRERKARLEKEQAQKKQDDHEAEARRQKSLLASYTSTTEGVG